MPLSFSRRAFLGLLALLLVAGSFIPLSTQALAQSDEQIDRDDPLQKSTDLVRARANHDVSPDRLIVVYQQATGTQDAQRQRVRQQVGAQVLNASRTLQR